MRLIFFNQQVLQAEHLVELYMSENNISQLYEDIFQFENLTVLDLNSNFISVIPSNLLISDTKLCYLYLNRNKLTMFPNVTFLDKLVQLHVGSNYIETIPEGSLSGLGNLNLLNVSDNYLKEFPNISAVQSCLTHLYMSHNNLSSIAVSSSATGWMNMAVLVRVDLSFNHIAFIDEDLFKYWTQLVTLKLQYNEISQFPNLSPIGKSLKHIQLNNNKLTTVPQIALQNMTALIALNLKANMLSAFPISVLRNMPNLLWFTLDKNNFTTFTSWVQNASSSQLVIHLESNPLFCSADICWAKQYEHRVTLSSQPCKAGPPDLIGIKWHEIAAAELGCPGNTCVKRCAEALFYLPLYYLKVLYYSTCSAIFIYVGIIYYLRCCITQHTQPYSYM